MAECVRRTHDIADGLRVRWGSSKEPGAETSNKQGLAPLYGRDRPCVTPGEPDAPTVVLFASRLAERNRRGDHPIVEGHASQNPDLQRIAVRPCAGPVISSVESNYLAARLFRGGCAVKSHHEAGFVYRAAWLAVAGFTVTGACAFGASRDDPPAAAAGRQECASHRQPRSFRLRWSTRCRRAATTQAGRLLATLAENHKSTDDKAYFSYLGGIAAAPRRPS